MDSSNRLVDRGRAQVHVPCVVLRSMCPASSWIARAGAPRITEVSEEDLRLTRFLDEQYTATFDGRFCLDALEAALADDAPEVFNTDQGAQFTASAFTERVEAAGAQVSMDGRGRALDNV